MGKYRLESYRGRSMESGPDGWDGISRAEDNVIDDDLGMDLVRQALMEVPGDAEDNIVVNWEKNENNSTQLIKQDEHEYEDEQVLTTGDEEYERFLAEIMGYEYQSKSMSDMARDISQSMDVPTVRDVDSASRNILDEMNRDNDEYDR